MSPACKHSVRKLKNIPSGNSRTSFHREPLKLSFRKILDLGQSRFPGAGRLCQETTGVAVRRGASRKIICDPPRFARSPLGTIQWIPRIFLLPRRARRTAFARVQAAACSKKRSLARQTRCPSRGSRRARIAYPTTSRIGALRTAFPATAAVPASARSTS